MTDPTDDGDLVVALVDLRNAITPLVNDLMRGARPSVARWLAFAEVISDIIRPVRHAAFMAALDEHGRTTDDVS